MTIQDELRTDLQDEVFNEIGKTVTLKSKGEVTYNARGEEEYRVETTSSIVVVPYNITDSSENRQAFGNFEDGDMALAIPYTVTIKLGDVVTIESQDWVIKEIQPNYLPDNVVTIALVTKANTVTIDN